METAGDGNMNHAWWMALAIGSLGCSSDYKVEAAASSFSVSPDLSDLGIVVVGQTVPFVVTVTHTGGAPLDIVSAEVINVEGTFFSTSDVPIPEGVESDEAVDLYFNYVPGAEGYHYGRVIIKTTASEEPERMVEMRAQAASPSLAIYPSVIDFGPVDVGTSSVEELTVVNEGTIAVTIDDVPIDNDVFGVSSGFSLPVYLDKGERMTIPFEFTPEDSDEQTSDAAVDLDAGITFAGIHLRGNACSTASGSLYDQDGDGYSVCGTDCNDRNPDIRPGVDEVCNGLDDDCNGTADEGTSCYDDDGDGQTEDEGDCNDADAEIFVGAIEDMANGKDDDCDGVVDSGATDLDGDGYSDEGGDCEPFDASVHPSAIEYPDGVDNDCDGIIDEGTNVYDDDGDGLSEVEGDCDDSDDRISPAELETADWLDNDCDGMVDEGTIHADDDGDGFSELGGDCDDTNPSMNPGHPELPDDGLDNNCDGITL